MLQLAHPEDEVVVFDDALVRELEPLEESPAPVVSASKVPQFTPLPDLPCPSWVSADLRGRCEQLRAESAEILEVRRKLTDKIASRSSIPIEKLTVSKAGQRQREEHAILAREVAFRKDVRAYYAALDAEARTEDQRICREIAGTRDKIDADLEEALTKLGIVRVNEWHLQLVEQSSILLGARRHASVLDGLRSRLKIMRHETPIAACVRRMELLHREVIDMC